MQLELNSFQPWERSLSLTMLSGQKSLGPKHAEAAKERGLGMRNNKKLWILVATWVWWTALLVAPTCSEGTTELQFTLVKSDATASLFDYSEFIRGIRKALTSDVSDQGIPRLKNPTELSPDCKQLVLLRLVSGDHYKITLVMNVTNVNLLGYKANNVLFHFQNVPAAFLAPCFPGATLEQLPFGNSYASMRPYTRDRLDIELGMVPFEEAVDTLYYSTSNSKIAESLVICTEMIPEAVRFRYIEGLVRRSIAQDRIFKPDALMYSVVEKWDTLSERIQKSTHGSFDAVQLGLPGNQFYWDNVGQAITRVSLMLFVCNPPTRTPLLIRSLGDRYRDGPFCSEVETTVRIVGRESLCVAVKDGNYTDGNAIQLFQCKDALKANQLWTLKKDGTIQSNGKCLTAENLHLGEYIMIYNCATAATNLTRWQVWQNGTIINPASQFVLNAPSMIPGNTLDVQRNTYAASQSWTVTNVTKQPGVQSIVGFNNNQCLDTNGTHVRLADCAAKDEQSWALEADSTIRPQLDRTTCLSCEGDDCVVGAKLIIIDCGGGYPTTRWYFENDGSIVNPGSGLMIGVDISSNQINVNAAKPGNPNQEWFLMP